MRQTAKMISKAFETFAEQVSEEQDVKIASSEKNTLKEINLSDLATKTDLQTLRTEMKVELHQVISSAKWQVLGAIGAMLFGAIILKHFGLF
jgi:hypothetical protein